MEKMNQAFEKMKMLVGVEVEDEEQAVATEENSFMDEFNRNCTLTTKQVLKDLIFTSIVSLKI